MQRAIVLAEYFSNADHHLLAGFLVGQGDPLAPSDSEINEVIQTARAHRVDRMLEWSLRQRGIKVEESAWRALARGDQAAVRRYLIFKSAFQDVTRALGKANIPAVWLKGWALAHTIYPMPTLRPMRDLDLLVPPTERERAKACLAQLGYTQDEYPQLDVVREMRHHDVLRGRVTVELHTKLIGLRSKLFGESQREWFWAHTRVLTAQDFQYSVFVPEAELLYLCAHALLQHGENEFLLQRYLDIHLLIRQNPQLDWGLVLEQAVEFRWSFAVMRALEITRDHFGTTTPNAFLSELASRRHADEDPRNTVWIAADSTRFETTRGLLRGMGKREKIVWALASLFPPPSFVQWRYHVSSVWQIPFFYFYRWFSMARDVLQTMLKYLKSKIHARTARSSRSQHGH